jgi:uncharacterized protein (TIGR03032 family)
MKLESLFYKLPLHFDADRLAREVSQFSEDQWIKHPSNYAGNSALLLIAYQGDPTDDRLQGEMKPTPYLERCPYLKQVLASFQTVLGRTRLMRVAGGEKVPPHVDVNYYWQHRVRIHVPIITSPEVRFTCNGKSVHMDAGETWIFNTTKTHTVDNPSTQDRIHLVADTVGSPNFWDLVKQAETPLQPQPQSRFILRDVPFDLRHKVQLATETVNFPVVMTIWEQKCFINDYFAELQQVEENSADTIGKVKAATDFFERTWSSLWARYGENQAGWQEYRQALNSLETSLKPFAAKLKMSNGFDAVQTLNQLIIQPALNTDLKPENSNITNIESRTNQDSLQFDRPIIIVSTPRSGSTLLFETLAQSPDLWTIGGESHGVFEAIPELQPGKHNSNSNRLTAEDATEEISQQLRYNFISQLKNRAGKPLDADTKKIRLLEKTPKNALRIPFLNAVFPDALFIYLYREPQENISSILEAWRSQRFVTYPQLSGWQGEPWSLVLTPDWQKLNGKSLAEIAATQWQLTNQILLDDLEQLPRDRWCAISYADFLNNPQQECQRLCDFARINWDQKLVDNSLPLSRHTLTPPDPDKWRKNEAELKSVLPSVENIVDRARAIIKSFGGDPQQAIPHPIIANKKGKNHQIKESSQDSPKTSKEDLNDREKSPLRSLHSHNFPDLLRQLKSSLIVSTYQAGWVAVISAKDNGLDSNFHRFNYPMGIAYDGRRLAIGTRTSILEFHNQRDAARKIEPKGKHDACFLHRMTHVTGNVSIHEIDWSGDELWFINTRFSTLCTLGRDYSFVPRWRPPFVSAITPEDRCHLNGLAMREKQPRYATVLGKTDKPNGWREVKSYGGCLLDINSGVAIVEGLCMPHSPCWHDNRLWVLESGAGNLCVVDEKTGKLDIVATLPGFTRGLDFIGPFAFIGLSQVRETAVFAGLPITETTQPRHCGVWVVDTRDGKTVAFLRFEGAVQEIFDLRVLPGLLAPVLSLEEDLVADSFVLPNEALAEIPWFQKNLLSQS